MKTLYTLVGYLVLGALAVGAYMALVVDDKRNDGNAFAIILGLAILMSIGWAINWFLNPKNREWLWRNL